MTAAPVPSRALRPRISPRRLDQLTILLPTLLATTLCAIELGNRSLWLDEGTTVAIASQHGAALWHGIAHDGGNMLAYYLLIHVIIGAFGDGSTVIRLPSMVADAATAAIVASLGLRLFANRRIALSAGLLSAVSLPLVFWGQDARGYAWMAALGAGSFLALTVIVQTPAGVRPPLATVFAFGLTTLLGLYVGYDSVLLTAAQVLLVVGCFRDRTRVVLGTLAGVAVLCVPLLILAVERGSSQLFWVPALGGAVLAQAGTTLASAGFPNLHRTSTTFAAAALTGVLLIAVLVFAVRRRREHSSPTNLALALVSTWLLGPTVLAVGAGLMGEPIELSRAAILLIPALSLLLGWGFWHPSLPRGAGLALLLTVLALRVLQLAPSYGVSPENWSAATGYVLTATRSDPACVAFYPQDGREAFDYYLHAFGASATRLTPILPTAAWSKVHPYVERYRSLGDRKHRAGIARHCTSVWLIASHTGHEVGSVTSKRDYQRYVRVLGQLNAIYGRPLAAEFGFAARVNVFEFRRGIWESPRFAR